MTTVLAFSALWIVLAGYQDPTSWILGVPTVIAALWAKRRLSPSAQSGLSALGVLRLTPTFFVESFRGGIDVARRVLRLRPKLDPGLVQYELRLTPVSARVLFVDLVSLLPGTLSADLRGYTLWVHTLDRTNDCASELERLEGRVAAVFKETLADEVRHTR